MEDLELMRSVTIGQYLPTGSSLHRLDVRAKLVALGGLISVVLMLPSPSALLAALLVILSLIWLANVPLGFALGGLRPTLPVLLLLAALQLIFGWGANANPECLALWSAGVINLTTCAVSAVLAMLLRLTCLILLTGLLTMTSTISELTHGLESLLRPFQRLGLPAHELSLSFTLALRFVPTLTEELEKLLKAQAARGADIRLGSNPLQRVRQLLPVLVPLFLTTLRRGEVLIQAMTARGYSGGAGRTHFIQLKMKPIDWLAILLVLGISAGLVLAPFSQLDAAWLGWLAGIAGQ